MRNRLKEGMPSSGKALSVSPGTIAAAHESRFLSSVQIPSFMGRSKEDQAAAMLR